MKKLLTILLLSMLALGLSAQGDYTSLWKKYEKAMDNDYPQTALSHLKTIEEKAEKEKLYGHLISALYKEAIVLKQLSDDSIAVMRERLKEKYRNISKVDPVAGCIYKLIPRGDKAKLVDSLLYHTNPELVNELTKENGALKYVPLVKKGQDSKYFYHDLISVIAEFQNDYEPLARFYSEKGNRKTACIAAAKMLDNYRWKYDKNDLMKKADSLIAIYGDLNECGAIASRKLNFFTGDRNEVAKKQIEWIDEAIKRWPQWQDVEFLKYKRSELIAPTIQIRAKESTLNTQQEAKLFFENTRNIKKVDVSITPILQTYHEKFEDLDWDDQSEWPSMNKYLQKGKVINLTKELAKHEDYEYFEDSLSIGNLPLGLYLVEVKCDGKNIKSDEKIMLMVSDLKVIYQQQDKRQVRYVVVNAISGQPVAGAQLHLDENILEEYTKKTVSTNEKGEYIHNNIEETSRRSVYATTDTDKAMLYYQYYSSFYDYKKDNSVSFKVKGFTDRALYRPGQTVHVSFLTYNLIGNKETKVAPNKELTVTLKNAEYKEIANVKVVSDDFGVATTDFVLPENTKNGRFTIRANDKFSTTINVEEYVRPTFEVTISKPEIEYKDGDTIEVKGTAKTYSGVAVSNAKVCYTIQRNNSWWWRSMDNNSAILLEDTIQTDASGNFVMKMPMILPKENKDNGISPLRYWWHPQFYDIKATAVVTDIAGESHETQLSMPLSNRSTALTSDIKDKYLKGEKPIEITFTRRNNAGTEIAGEVSIEIDGKEQEKAVCGKSYMIPMYLPSGSHFIKAICGNDTIEKKFVLFSLEDKVPATETRDWWYETSKEFPATIQFGTCDKDVYAVYSIFCDNKIIESGALTLDSSVVARKFEYKEEYGDGICYTIAWVRNGKWYNHSTVIKRPLPDKTLKLNWTTFRNKLEPGQKEEWQLSITDNNGTPANANVMAVLYDKSLDALKSHSWYFNGISSPYIPLNEWKISRQDSYTSIWYSKYSKKASLKSFEFSTFDPYYPGYNIMNDFVVMGYGVQKKRSLTGSSMTHSLSEVKMAKAPVVAVGFANIESANDAVLEETEDNQEEVPIRTNLNETAFFMPQLRTDNKGIATLSFTLPESVTTWKFMAFAHDKDIRFGTMTDEVVAQKKLMIQPRLPRFLREGDITDIPASVSNLTEKDIDATVKFTILDAKTEKVLYTKNKKVTIKAGETEAVAFSYDSKNQEDKSIIVRYSVSGKSDEGTFSDGEQKDLPILSQKEFMVNTKTFILTEAGTKQFDLKSIMPSVNEKHLKVEYTDNPEWLMIKSLPSILKANDQCAICLAAAYYANSLASSIAHSNPDIQKAVKEWNSEEMAQLFDSLSSGNRKTDALERLTQLQNNDGSWSWWYGMDGSSYMTVHVLKTLLRLNLMTNDEKIKKQNEQLIKRACTFLDKEIGERYADMKEYKYLPSDVFDYLYCRALAKANGTKLSSNSKAEKLLKLVYEESRYDDMRTKAEAAIILYYGGKKSKAEEFIKSIKEHTVYRDDLGRYFDSKRAAYSWCDYKIPTQVSVIEALKLIDSNNSAKEIVEMKRWLLQSKRTQSWDTPINAIDAIYAFLCPSQGTTTSLRKGVPADIALGKTRLEAQEYTSALGYVKTSKDITSKDKVLSFTKHTNGESWANVFIEYKQAATESSESSTGLSITRKVETNGKELKVGDKVEVTITITADRDYDFVTVTDNRPACLEPVEQLSGYSNGTYKIVRDTKTEYCYNMMRKGTHVIKTSYYVARTGNYTSGIATATCTYSPVFTGRTPGSNYVVK